ncbi:MAG: hypothetical protein IPP77_14640 [Bacteroidetes bacterium]|nr:hypothetical protein [Bacteroidota bacterium]
MNEHCRERLFQCLLSYAIFREMNTDFELVHGRKKEILVKVSDLIMTGVGICLNYIEMDDSFILLLATLIEFKSKNKFNRTNAKKPLRIDWEAQTPS